MTVKKSIVANPRSGLNWPGVRGTPLASHSYHGQPGRHNNNGEEMEKIICSAIKVVDTGKIFYGHRHHNCFEALFEELGWESNRQQLVNLEKIQGFVTTEGRFVNREEAYKIATKCGQLKVDSRTGPLLFSEDLYDGE